MQRARAGDAAHRHHQPHRRHAQRGAGGVHRLVFEAVLVGLEQQLQRLAAERIGQRQRLELGFVLGLHLGLLLLALERGQRGLQLVFRRALVAAPPLAAEIDRVAVQRLRQRGLLHHARARAVVFGGQVGKAELFLGRAFPQEVQVDLADQLGGLAHQLDRRGLRKLQQHVARLDLGALARGQFHLVGLALLGQHGAGANLAAFFEQQLHGSVLSEMPGAARRSRRLASGNAARNGPVREMKQGAAFRRGGDRTRDDTAPRRPPAGRGPPCYSDMPPLASIATPLT